MYIKETISCLFYTQACDWIQCCAVWWTKSSRLPSILSNQRNALSLIMQWASLYHGMVPVCLAQLMLVIGKCSLPSCSNMKCEVRTFPLSDKILKQKLWLVCKLQIWKASNFKVAQNILVFCVYIFFCVHLPPFGVTFSLLASIINSVSPSC